MRTFIVAGLSTVAFAQRGMGMGRMGSMWWGAAPECAQTCLSSAYSAEASQTVWPDPGHFCTASISAPLSSCLSASCTATPTAYSSMQSLTKSLCSVWSSCTSASDAVFTITLNVPTGTGIHASEYGPYHTYTGDGTITVTGCPTAGIGFGGYGGHGGYGHMNPWGGSNPDGCFWGWGQGWSSLSTMTTTTTSTITGADGSTTPTLVVQTYAQAVTDGTTTSTPVGASGTATPTGTGIGAGGTNSCVATGTGTGANATSFCTVATTGTNTAAGTSSTGTGSSGSTNDVAYVGAALAAVVAVAGLL